MSTADEIPANQAGVAATTPNSAAPNASWTRERIEKMLESGKFSYQRIDLPHGLATPGEDRRPTADLIFPASLAGKSVLDLGCNHGFFCFDALQRGAESAVGYDHSAPIVRRANRLADIKDSHPDFLHHDLDREPVNKDFDFILCLNVLHHLDNPLLQLEQMMAHTRDTLVLELAGFSLFDCFRALEVSRWFALLAFLVTPFPVMFIGLVPGAKKADPKRLKFYFTRRAIKRLFARQSERFASVRFVRSPFKGRFLVIAQRNA